MKQFNVKSAEIIGQLSYTEAKTKGIVVESDNHVYDR